MGYQLARWAALETKIAAPTQLRWARAKIALIVICMKAKDTDPEPWATVDRAWLILQLDTDRKDAASEAAHDLTASGLIRIERHHTDGSYLRHNKGRWIILRP